MNVVSKAQLRSLELRFNRRLQILDQIRHTTLDDRRSGWRRRRHSDPDVYRRPAFDLCSSRRDLPDHGAFAVRRLLLAERAEAQFRCPQLRSDFPTQIFEQVWHSTQRVTLGLLIDFRRHSDRDPNVNVGPASDFCSRSRRLLDDGPASMPIRLDLLDASERQALPCQVTPGARSVGEFRDDADRDVLGRLWSGRRPLRSAAYRFNGL